MSADTRDAQNEGLATWLRHHGVYSPALHRDISALLDERVNHARSQERERLIEVSARHANLRRTLSGPAVWSVSIAELADIINTEVPS